MISPPPARRTAEARSQSFLDDGSSSSGGSDEACASTASARRGYAASASSSVPCGESQFFVLISPRRAGPSPWILDTVKLDICVPRSGRLLNACPAANRMTLLSFCPAGARGSAFIHDMTDAVYPQGCLYGCKMTRHCPTAVFCAYFPEEGWPLPGDTRHCKTCYLRPSFRQAS